MKQRIIEILRDSPGLTGKQIAKRLGGIDKSELNSYLYSHSDGLTQKDWKWYVAERYVFELSGQVWVDEVNFELDLLASGSMLDSSALECVVKFPADCKILLVAGARVIALANQAVSIGKVVSLDFTECPSTMRYLDRLGFFDHLESSVVVLPEKPKISKARRYYGSSENLVEIASINIEDFDFSLPEKLTKRFAYHAGKEYYGAAFTIFSELIGNVQEHSEASLPGFAALQLYKGRRRHIQTVISDSGLGISNTLKRNLEEHYPKVFRQLDLSSVDADIYLVSQALTKGGLSQFGSNPDEAARGLGLNRAQSYAAKYDAEVIVRQPSFELKLIYMRGQLIETRVKKGLAKIEGTHLCFDFFLD